MTTYHNDNCDKGNYKEIIMVVTVKIMITITMIIDKNKKFNKNNKIKNDK